MKKRVLSFLLLLAMLVTMVPAVAVFGSAEEPEEELPRSEVSSTDVETFYDLYKTEGLIAFFDAFDTSNGTLDIAHGKWYAKVYDAESGKFVKSETIYATLEGGAYDAATNPTGWKVGENGGFGYDDPEFAATNKLSFDKALLSGGEGALNAPWDFWTIESIIRVDLRSIPVEQRVFTAAEDAAHKLTVATEGDDLGTYAAKATAVTAKWGTTKEATAVVVGTPGTTAVVKSSVVGTGVTAEAKEYNVTFGTDGKATVSVQYKASYTDITVYTPEGVSVESITCPINTMKNAAYSNSSFLFGPLSARHWTNTQGQDYNGGGAGKCRWSVSKNPGSYTPPRVMVVAPGTSEWTDANSFIDNNGKVNSLVAAKATTSDTEITYTVTHGDHYRVGVAKTSDNYADLGLHIMNQEQGRVYAFRVYGTNDASKALTADDSKWNTSVDLLIRLGVDVAKFNKLNDDLKAELLLNVLPNIATTATKEEVEKQIDATIAYEENKANAKKLSIYDELYVGADGSRTANGGNLVDLFVAFGGDASVNLSSGTWINKLNDNNATFGNSKYWETRTDGSVGYTGFYGQLQADGSINTSASTDNISKGASSFTQTKLDFGIDMLPKDDYTIEYVAKYMPIYVANPDGTIAEDAKGNLLEYYNATGNGVPSSQYAGAVDYIGFISSWAVSRDGHYSGHAPNRGDVIWMLHDGNAAWGANINWLGSAAWGSGGLKAPNIRENGAVHTYVMMRDESLSVDPATGGRAVEATFATLRDATIFNTCKVSTVNTAKGTEYFDKDDGGSFFLSSMLPTDFYAVRIYNTALTVDEMKWNNFIDMAAYVKADLNDFLALDATTQSLVVGLMAGQGFPAEADAFAEALKDTVEIYKDPVTAEESLYVTDGLRVLTAAYAHFHTGSLAVGESSISWFNAARIGESVDVKGKGWTLRPDGGYYMIKDMTEFSKDGNFGIYLTPDMLPEDDYTVQMVLNPTGIVDYQPDGTYTRHIDEQTTYGYNYEHGFTIGPLRCLLFPSDAVGGQRAGMQKRWCYNYGNRCWNGLDTAGRNQIMTENAWKFVGVNDIVSYAITLENDAAANLFTYRIYSDNEICNTASRELTSRYTNEQANNMFQLMCYQPGGVFSIRVYDRVLTEAEMIQNQAVDVIYYYGLDTSLLDQVLVYFKGQETKVFRGLAELGFDMPKEEAQRIFDARLSALWISFSEVGVRNDGVESIRYYFDLDEATATTMINAGFRVEVGAIANINQNAAPTIDGRNYEYRIVAYDSVGGKTSGFFVDEDTFAVTFKAGSISGEALLSSIQVRGYVSLIAQDGSEMTFYAEPSGDGYTPDSFFSIYAYMQSALALSDDYDLLNYLEEATDNCYKKDYVYLKADAPAGGNGTKDAPYNNYAEAFKAAKAKLAEINEPTFLYLYAHKGIYELNEVLTIDGSEIPYQYSRFIITSENGEGTLTSNKTIDAGDFVETEGNIWMYQFEADANGEYPNFRYLYVDGEIADIAHNGAANINENDVTRYNSPFYRFEDGPMMVAGEMYNAGTLTYDELYYPAEKVALRSRFAYYRDWYMAYQEVMGYNAAGTLTIDKQTANPNPTTHFNTLFEDFKYNRIVVAEFDVIFNTEANMVSPKMLDLLKDRETSKTNPPEAYKAQFREMRDLLIKEMTSSPNYVQCKSKLNIALPKVFTTTEADEQTLTAFSSGVFAQVKALYTVDRANKNDATYVPKLTHDRQPLASEASLAQGAQFIYYRDAFLALAEVEDLLPSELVFDAQPKAEGSEQFQALFKEFLYKKIAMNELAEAQAAFSALGFENIKHGEFTYKSAMGSYETKYEDAPEEYVAVLRALRDDGMINFTYFKGMTLDVFEADGPYNGNVPLYDPRDESKVYFQKDLVGDQSFAIEQGFNRLEADAEKLVADAYAAYLPSYEAFMNMQAHQENLVFIGKLKREAANPAVSAEKKEILLAKALEICKSDDLIAPADYEKNADFFDAQATTYLSTVNNYQKDCLALYNAYLKALKTADAYLDDETDERYTLKDSGLEFKMVVEWNFNIVHMSGVDYDDKIIKNGVEYIALYMNEVEYAGFVTHNESYFKGRMTTMQFSHAYLDKDNEYYYDAVTGTLYYCNEEGVDGKKFEYPTMQNMFYFTNVERMTISKMNFTGLDDRVVTEGGFTGGQASGSNHFNDELGINDIFPSRAAIYTDRVYDMVVESCTFHDLGCEGITHRMKAKNFTISDNVFRNIGSSAIRIGGSSSGSVAFNQNDGAENVLITNNLLDGIALYLFTSPALYMQYAKDIQMTYNTIINCSYTGISIGWSWSSTSFMYGEGVKLMHCEIAYNFITNFMMELGDGGALYTLGGNASKDEHYLFNWAHDNYFLCSNVTGDGEQHFFAANYHDGSSTNWETYNTVVVAHSYGAAYPDDPYKSPVDEKIDDEFFENIPSGTDDLDKEEYQRRLRNRRYSIYYFYEQTVEGADSYNITLHDNYLINSRVTNREGNKCGSQLYEAFRGRAREEYFIYVENHRFVRNPGNLPGGAEDIIYEAGCDLFDGIYKGDPFVLMDNNY